MSRKPELKWLDEDLVEVRWVGGPITARMAAERRTKRKVKRVMHVAGYTYQVTLEPTDEQPCHGRLTW